MENQNRIPIALTLYLTPVDGDTGIRGLPVAGGEMAILVGTADQLGQCMELLQNSLTAVLEQFKAITEAAEPEEITPSVVLTDAE